MAICCSFDTVYQPPREKGKNLGEICPNCNDSDLHTTTGNFAAHCIQGETEDAKTND